MLDPIHPICREGAGGLLLAAICSPLTRAVLCPFLGIKVIFGVRILGLSSVNSAGGCVESLFELSQPGGAVVFICSLCGSLQLFRRVAAALPGMESTQDKSREDSILSVPVPGVTLDEEKPLQPSRSSWTSQKEGA